MGKLSPLHQSFPAHSMARVFLFRFDLQANFRYAAIEGKLLLGEGNVWVLWLSKYILWCWYLNVLCVARHIGKSLSHVIKCYRCYIQCLPALSPLSLPLLFKENPILTKIHYNRDSIKIQGDPIPLHSYPIQPSWKLKQSRWHHMVCLLIKANRESSGVCRRLYKPSHTTFWGQQILNTDVKEQ